MAIQKAQRRQKNKTDMNCPHRVWVRVWPGKGEPYWKTRTGWLPYYEAVKFALALGGEYHISARDEADPKWDKPDL